MPRGGDETYETPVTVRCDGEPGRGRLDAGARTAGPKATHIVPARGRMVSRPMLTLRGGDGLAAQQAAAHGLVTGLRKAGFAPARVKTETTPWAAEVATAPTAASSTV
ncbi:hypothetical protein [Streptomyces sp. t39]|uniref:hypothetical protein n=1 Tax=Streptomyces sp. t39 TaxID=1828156 RepID=UPI0011CD80F5|nr:hypothetical protein [Streptomyces sp. t39]TXS55042.1 hypothetical protein EAO77_01620 [Streptomyces sp. t39]